MDRLDAERTAKRVIGNESLVREFSGDEMLPRWIDAGRRDIRYAVRTLLRTPVFTFSIALTLAIGIGANTAIFSLVDRVLLRPLPFPNADQLVLLHERKLEYTISPRMDVNPSNWLDWQEQSLSFESLAAWSPRFALTLSGQGEPERLQTETVSHEFFAVLDVKPLLGRVFSPEDDRPQEPPKAVVSHSLWQRKFGGDSNIAGKVVALNGTPTEVVGVMPAGFHFLSRETDVWATFRLDRNLPWRERAGRFLPYVVGRMKPSVTVEAVQQEMESIASRLAQLRGRDFTHENRVGTPFVFIVNEAFVEKYFPAEDPLAASISVAMQEDPSFGQIIGVVGDVKEGTLRGSPAPTVFYNYRQLLSPGLTFFVRSSRGAEPAREARQILREMDSNLPLIEVRMLEDAFAESLARERLNAVVSAAFAVGALLLASLGLYGLLSFVVAERASEIGIRMALGAQISQVLRMIIGHGLAVVALGAVIGLGVALAASRLLRTLLFGVTPHDPATFAGVATLLVVVSLAAVVIPARRAARLSPATVLREE